MLFHFLTHTVLGTDLYHVIQWFLAYSILGWVVESIYMSICNRKLTNRGFARSPICPIYGVGALSVYFLLRPFAENLPLLYVMGCIIPTLLELVTAKIMLRVFGEVWWDYSEKPLNYQGILCLESTIAWGFYTLGLFLFLQDAVERFVDSYSFAVGSIMSTLIVTLYMADFLQSMYKVKKEELPDSLGELFEEIRAMIGK